MPANFGFATLALIVAVGLLGPLLAAPKQLRIPVVVGELGVGLLFGQSGLKVLDPTNPTFSMLADVGFALVMFVVGSHVPIRDVTLRSSMPKAALRAVLVGAVAVGFAVIIAQSFHTGHTLLFAVLIASSSAALALPMLDSLGLGGPAVLSVTAQIAIADTASIVLLPLVIDPPRAGRAALGSLAIGGCAVLIFLVLRHYEAHGRRKRLHRYSERHRLALELRISLLLLFALAALATAAHVSIMLAGFALGLVLSAVGQPRRLARQLFGITEGFFGPLFFVWLGSSLRIRELGADPRLIGLGLALGVAAVLAHLVGALLRQPVAMAALSSAQLGVPVAAAALGTESALLEPGEPSALILGALVTVVVTSIAARAAGRRNPVVATGEKPSSGEPSSGGGSVGSGKAG